MLKKREVLRSEKRTHLTNAFFTSATGQDDQNMTTKALIVLQT